MTDAGRDPDDSEGPEDGESSKEIWVEDRGELGSLADPVAEDELGGGTAEQNELQEPSTYIQPSSGQPPSEREASDGDVDEVEGAGDGAAAELDGGTEEQNELQEPSTYIQPSSGRPPSETEASDEGAGSDRCVSDGESDRCDGVDSTERGPSGDAGGVDDGSVGDDAEMEESAGGGEDEDEDEGEGEGGGVDE